MKSTKIKTRNKINSNGFKVTFICNSSSNQMNQSLL